LDTMPLKTKIRDGLKELRAVAIDMIAELDR
jgi:hypothetical protein